MSQRALWYVLHLSRALCVLLVLFYLADLTSAGLEQQLREQTCAPTPPVVPPPPQQPPGPVPEFGVLDTAPPVPRAEASPSEPAATASGLPALTLKGTILSGPIGLAVVEVEGRTRVMSPGETVGGLVLLQAEADSATFRMGKQEVVLPLNESAAALPSAVPGAPTAAAPPSATSGPAEPTGPPDRTGGDLHAVLDDPARLAGQLRFNPVNRDGQPYGLKVSFLTPDNVLAAGGIQDGDLLLTLNGLPMRSFDDFAAVRREVGRTDELSFQVERQGQVVTVRYELKN